mmetsp:Transcript_32124/g.43860  ORF Transcript_32124/g.43860 Transcript_32124/m.43860 type:complete len:169 (+) Transcript_32124:436-942(+)|eukprot:CAMPEP_0201092758 /NCGR_PEP_ID=MMETSP0812-20130820/1311_1 /ASSEMBLY_ACC=CAM_ASM_000668 /TAXON_ID=98059 /ORGANISM="Dinobryon sp., Strain UTEXLB2267" /LENGTH=168 /DNA_ID=CAMNT_0047344519 /DNA_START=436 /DNA_END=942 /DNA_ORIENTATION=+
MYFECVPCDFLNQNCLLNSVQKILSTFRKFRKNLQEAPNHEEKNACRPFWDKLRELLFDDQECRVDNAERSIETYCKDIFDEESSGIKRCRVTGIPDGSIMWKEQAIHIWELKDQHYLLDGISKDSLVAYAQIAMYMKADIESMWKTQYLASQKLPLIFNNLSLDIVS